MRVIIAGGRNFSDYNLLRESCLDIFRDFKSKGYNTNRNNLTIVSGTANGADKLGEQFQNEFKLKLKSFPAKWNDLTVEMCTVREGKYGKYNALAGHNRNEEMAKYASEDSELGVLIAFHDGKSSGTRNMIDLAKRYCLEVVVVDY